MKTNENDHTTPTGPHPAYTFTCDTSPRGRSYTPCMHSRLKRMSIATVRSSSPIRSMRASFANARHSRSAATCALSTPSITFWMRISSTSL